jgi:hypothetical protein
MLDCVEQEDVLYKLGIRKICLPIGREMWIRIISLKEIIELL